MQSIREQIVRRCIATLEAAIAPVQVLRQPVHATETEKAPVVLFSIEGDAPERQSNDRMERKLTVRIEAVAAKKAATPDPFATADDLISKAHMAILADPQMHGGMALRVAEAECEYQSEALEVDVVSIPARYQITYRTMITDLTIQG
jgi:hypothetical protein